MRTRLGASIAAGAALALAVAGLGLGVGPTPLDAARLAARYTGRLSFAIFAGVFALGPQRGTAGERWAIHGWPTLAAAHLVHLGFLLRYLAMSENFPAPGRLAGGVLGYAVLLAIAAGHARAARAGGVSPRLVRGTHLGGGYLALAFVLTYLPRITRPEALGVEDWWGYGAMLAAAAALPMVRGFRRWG